MNTIAKTTPYEVALVGCQQQLAALQQLESDIRHTQVNTKSMAFTLDNYAEQDKQYNFNDYDITFILATGMTDQDIQSCCEQLTQAHVMTFVVTDKPLSEDLIRNISPANVLGIEGYHSDHKPASQIEVIEGFCQSMLYAITQPSIVNLDYYDFQTVFAGSQVAFFSFEGDNVSELVQEVSKANIKAAKLDMSTVTGLIVNMSVDDLRLSDYQSVIEPFNGVNDDATIFYGTSASKSGKLGLDVYMAYTSTCQSAKPTVISY